MILTSTRLLLRDYTPADFSQLYAIDTDPAVTQMRGGTAIVESRYREQFARILEGQSATPRRNYHFVVVTESTQDLIGHCFLHSMNTRTREASLGYFLRPDAWGQGYATEIAGRLLEFGFDNLGLHRISAGCIATNTASARVLEKIGMQREGQLREDRLTDAGDWHDTLLYAILKREWRTRD